MNTDIQLTPHFHLREFLHAGAEKELTPTIIENLRKTAQMMEGIRKICGDRPITITSGYRTPAHNKAVGGAKNSYHVKGMAADFVVEGLAPSKVQKLLENHNGGLEYAPTWTHADWGPKRRFYP